MRNLNKKDTFSFILSAIYAAEADPDYSVLADLIYMLDEDKFKKFMALFEGQTIKIPSIRRLTLMLEALMVYAYVDIEGKPLQSVMAQLGTCNNPGTSDNGPAEYVKLKKLIEEKKVEIGGALDGFPPPSLLDFH